MQTTKEAASCLGISEKTLANWRVSGIGPKYLKVGRLVRYREEDIQSWLSARTFTATFQSKEAA